MRITAISTLVSAVICSLCLMLLLVSNWLNLPDFADSGNDIDSNASFSIGTFHCAISRGCVWFFNDDLPYTGSIMGLQGSWGGKRATERTDWCWRISHYGIDQMSYIDDQGQSAGKDRGADFPGIYYRHFEWANETSPWWTLAVSLWYPVAVSAILPSWWLIRRLSTPRRFSLRLLFAAVTIVALGLGIAVWLKS
jgi:hypothetical protein